MKQLRGCLKIKFDTTIRIGTYAFELKNGSIKTVKCLKCKFKPLCLMYLIFYIESVSPMEESTIL